MKLKQDIREGKVSPSRLEKDSSIPQKNTVSLADLSRKKDIEPDLLDDLSDDVRHDQ